MLCTFTNTGPSPLEKQLQLDTPSKDFASYEVKPCINQIFLSILAIPPAILILISLKPNMSKTWFKV